MWCNALHRPPADLVYHVAAQKIEVGPHPIVLGRLPGGSRPRGGHLVQLHPPVAQGLVPTLQEGHGEVHLGSLILPKLLTGVGVLEALVCLVIELGVCLQPLCNLSLLLRQQLVVGLATLYLT